VAPPLVRTCAPFPIYYSLHSVVEVITEPPKAICTNDRFSKFQNKIEKQEDFRFAKKNEKF
jgi:hypothetical protein